MKAKNILESTALQQLNEAARLNNEVIAKINDPNAMKKLKIAESCNNNAGKRVNLAMAALKIHEAGKQIEDYFD